MESSSHALKSDSEKVERISLKVEEFEVSACLSISGEFPLNKRMPMLTTSGLRKGSGTWPWSAECPANALMTSAATELVGPWEAPSATEKPRRSLVLRGAS